jgi:hypothetical protein
VSVQHGLAGSGRAPAARHITVVPLTSPTGTGPFHVTGITPTAFRIAVPTAPATGSAEFSWHVDVTRR